MADPHRPGLRLYVYAIGREPCACAGLDLEGIGGARVGTVSCADLFVAASPLEGPPTATEAAVLAHERVVEHAMEGQTVVPMRFGCVAASQAAIEEVLRRRYRQVTDDLAFVDGCVEFRVGIEAGGEGVDESRRGASRSADLGRVRVELAGFAVASRWDRGQPSGPLSASYLVARSGICEFLEACGVTRACLPGVGVRVSVGGPWPPYSFVRPYFFTGTADRHGFPRR